MAKNKLPAEPKLEQDPTKRVFMLTDGCMWEINKRQGTFFPHSIEVIDIETGQVRYIKSGAKIMFVDGDISEGRSQEFYNSVK
jgi:hypothetical protein